MTEDILHLLVIFLKEVIFPVIKEYLLQKVKSHSSIGGRKSGQSSNKEDQ